MKSGITTYEVVNDTWKSVFSKVIQAMGDPKRVVRFEALPLDGPDLNPEPLVFTARVETIHMNAVPMVVDLVDEYTNWFQIYLDPDKDTLTFKVIYY